MGRTVAIIGKAINALSAPTSVGIERWGINGSFRPLARAVGADPETFDAWDRWFDLHTLAHITRHRPHALPWYRSRDGSKPIYHWSGYAHGAQNGVPLPHVELQKYWAPRGRDINEFFTSSLDWMLALAGWETAEGDDPIDRIELWGVDLWAGKERATQRDGGHYWIGKLEDRMEVFIPDESSLCKVERLYGPFTLTSGRNFCSMNAQRFFDQVKAAQAMKESSYVPPGVDEHPRSAASRR